MPTEVKTAVQDPDHACEMIDAHHPDCECQTCLAGEDSVCGQPAVGFLRDGAQRTRVCAECAKMAEDDPEAYGTLTRYVGAA